MSSQGFDAAREALAEQARAPAQALPTSEGAKASLGRARKLVLIGGLLAGLIAFGIGEAIYDLIPAQLSKQTVAMAHVQPMLPTPESLRAAATKNAMLAFGVLGLCLGGCLGMAGGLARRSTSSAATAGFLGAVLAAAACTGVSLALVPYCLRAQADHPSSDLVIALVMHGLIWGLAGAMAGLAFAVGLGERRRVARALTAGLAGAVLGAVAFDLLGAAFFASADTVNPISITWPTRLMARLLVTIGAAVVLTLLKLEDKQEARPSHA